MIKKVFFSFFLIITLNTKSQENDTLLVKYKTAYDDAKRDTIRLQKILDLGEYLINRDFKKAKKYFNEGLDIISKDEKRLEKYKIAIYVQLGVINRREANYDKAIDYYLKSLSYYEKKEDESKIADVYHNMALVYRYQRNHKKAIENYKTAITLKEKVKDTFGLGAGYNMLGVSYRQNKQLDSALFCYEKAMYFFNAIKSKEDIHGVYGNLAALYAYQKKFDLSLPLKYKNLKYYKSIGKKLSVCVEYFNLSNDFKRMKKWKESLLYADSSLQVALEQGFKERISKAYLRKSFASKKLGEFENAYENYRMFNRYSDSIFNIQSAKKIQALELNYKFEKEKAELELKNKSEASKKKLYLLLFILSLISAALIGVLLRRNYLQKLKLDNLKFENEKKELSTEIASREKEMKQLIADNTMRVAFKEELIHKIKEEVVSKKPEQMKTTLNSLIMQLQLQVTTEKKLDGLQEKITEVNKEFDSVLREKFPELTKGEREVCALLRLNLSIKEIMTIRDVSVDSVKSMRKRIRKKMNVSSEIDLVEFIQNL
ncbi:tetratricopeptide repeat protein [Tenacibaculum agarivorans]|uniref:tetratricopeptide repeat protein n=1 Tax=Tenacibaculum agarivorans TaxID=1908389 RepID=UPI00094B7A67|nr:tetratricopeptide repeat protein [Tenacibaculum agarivorans]